MFFVKQLPPFPGFGPDADIEFQAGYRVLYIFIWNGKR
jgi:hypothetical protein